MKVLSVHAGADTGGIGWSLTGAFNGDPDVQLRSSVRTTNYIDYPIDLPWSEVPAFGRTADVVHLHNTFRTAGILGLSGKAKVLHHHGTHYRENADALNAQVAEAEAVAVVATLDLLDYGPNLTWVPHAYQLATLKAIRAKAIAARTPGGPLRIGHAPTDRSIKSTDAFLAACARVPGVAPVLIEKSDWANCLRVKAACDVYYDQVTLGYGCNAIEAWGMGIPVIAGAAESTLDRMIDTFQSLPPFYVATEHSIADAIGDMLEDECRELFTSLGTRHVERWHDGTETVARLTPIYEALARP